MTSEKRSANSLKCLSVVPSLAVFGPSSIVLLYLYISSRRSPARPPGGRAVGLKRSESPTTRVRRLVSTPPHSLLFRCLPRALLAPLSRPVPGSYPLVFSSPCVTSPVAFPHSSLSLASVARRPVHAGCKAVWSRSWVACDVPQPVAIAAPTIARSTATSRPSSQPIRPRPPRCPAQTPGCPERPFPCLCKAV